MNLTIEIHMSGLGHINALQHGAIGLNGCWHPKEEIPLAYTPTRKQLILQLASSIVMSFVAIMQLVIHLSADRPGWLIALILIPTPVFPVLATVIATDLIRKDFDTVHGVLIERIRIANGWKFRVQSSKREKPYTFRMNNQFDEMFSGIGFDQPIVVTCYRLTRAVHALEHGEAQGGQPEDMK